ncbi:sensor histidine kinase [Nocardioides nanhaiensis]|uniref:Sensor-like histidine kinase SenX3 n=1 Tax=Nocardioides nanhaiensis TaxID=1476871 RepID=A0ABP8WB57_9ACTN
MTATVDDTRRVLEIERYQILLQPPRSDLIALVEVAAQVADVPMATINLITEDEQHQVATVGFDASVCAREDSMCNVALPLREPIVVPDASQDPRFADNPFVTGRIGDVRFYASHQLRTPQGVTIGTLCVFDTVPRTLSPAQEASLGRLADRVVDILELELRTRELEQTRDELERSNGALTAFAGQVSHDLRSPLTSVRMAIDLIEEQLEDAAAAREDVTEARVRSLLGRASGGADRMQALIDDLLAYARLGGQLTREPVDLARLMAEVVEDLTASLAGAEVAVGELPTVPGDPAQLRAVLQNLVANSAKFHLPGEPARIEVSARSMDDCWLVTVVDHGIGIAPEDRERVFLPLARASDTVEGSGIGLATVKRIVEAHHGRISLEETPGGGTTALVLLPG